jgi:hypothetical protein
MTCPPPCGGSGGLKIRGESINFVHKRIMATFIWYFYNLYARRSACIDLLLNVIEVHFREGQKVVPLPK